MVNSSVPSGFEWIPHPNFCAFSWYRSPGRRHQVVGHSKSEETTANMTRQLGRAANGIEMNPIQNVGADVDAELPDLGIGPVGTASLPGPLTVAYITDVEGNYEYFKRCVDHSATLSFAPGSFAAGTTGAKAIDLTDEARLLLAKDSALVFGGDLFDKVAKDRCHRTTCTFRNILGHSFDIFKGLRMRRS